MSSNYPIFLDLAGRLAVVVGGGAVAARKVRTLLKAGASVRVVARRIRGAIARHGAQPPSAVRKSPTGRIQIVRGAFRPSHLKGACLVFACTDEARVNAAVAAAARRAGVPVNRADDPADCDFFVPAVHQAGPVKLAISTGGASPALAKAIRLWLDANLPKEWATLARELGRLRPMVRVRIPRQADRADLLEKLCGSDSLRILRRRGLKAWRAWATGKLKNRC